MEKDINRLKIVLVEQKRTGKWLAGKVEENNDNMVAMVSRYHYTEYEEKFDELKECLGRESVYSGLFDEVWKNIEVRMKQWSVDKQFLKQINDWRLMPSVCSITWMSQKISIASVFSPTIQ